MRALQGPGSNPLASEAENGQPIQYSMKRSGRKPNEIRNYFEVVEERPGTHDVVVCKFCKANNVPDPTRITSRVRNLRSHLRSCVYYTGPEIEEPLKRLKTSSEELPSSVPEEIKSRTIKGYTRDNELALDGSSLKIVIFWGREEQDLVNCLFDTRQQEMTQSVYESLVARHHVRKRNIAFVEVPGILHVTHAVKKLVASWKTRNRDIDVAICLGTFVTDRPRMISEKLDDRLERLSLELGVPAVNGLIAEDSHAKIANVIQSGNFAERIAALAVELGMLDENIETSKCPIPAN